MKKGYQYQLDTKTEDKTFLEGKMIRCKAAIPEKEKDLLQINSRIVILLSNGKKYMGEIKKIEFTIVNHQAEGYLEIERYPPLRQLL